MNPAPNESAKAMQSSRRPQFAAVITHKGRFVAELTGDNRKALQASAHNHASALGYHRAVVQTRQA